MTLSRFRLYFIVMVIKVPSIRKVTIGELIGYHPLVQPIVAGLASSTFVSRYEVLSDNTIRSLLQLHPIHAVEENKKLFVVAGFRSYQLSINRIDDDEKFPVWFYREGLSESRILDLANVDVLASPLIHSLGTKSASQIEILKSRIGQDNADSIAPGLKSTRSISRFEKLS